MSMNKTFSYSAHFDVKAPSEDVVKTFIENFVGVKNGSLTALEEKRQRQELKKSLGRKN